MKRIIAFILCITMMTTAAFSAVCADETEYIEYKCRVWTENVYYVRFDQSVNVTGESFRVEYVPTGSDVSNLLDTKSITIYANERLEIVLRFPEAVTSFTIYDLILHDGTHVKQDVKNDAVSEFEGLDDTWSTMERDILYFSPLVGKEKNDCYVAVGSEWALKYAKYTSPRDPYLRKHVSLTSEGIELEKEEEKYIFRSIGDGTVSLCIFGIPQKTVNVHVREKSEVKRKMLLTVPSQSFVGALYTVHWLGPLAFIIASPIAVVYTITTYFRLLFV